jgi:surface-anchored protein
MIFRHSRRWLAAATLVACATGPATAQALLTQGHTDIGAGFDTDTQTWDLHVHYEETDTEYGADEAILFVKPESATARPASAQYAFIGVAAGNPFYFLPQSEDPNLLFLGLSAEEVVGGTFDTYTETDGRLTSPTGEWIRWDLVSVTGAGGASAPGFFSAWLETSGGPVAYFDTADGITAGEDRAFILPGEDGHQDFNWGFTAPGVYEVTLTASALFGGQRVTSAPTTYTFAVANAPEPGVGVLTVAGALGFAVVRRRRK